MAPWDFTSQMLHVCECVFKEHFMTLQFLYYLRASLWGLCINWIGFFSSSLHKFSLCQWNLRLDLHLDNCHNHGLLHKVQFSDSHDSDDWVLSVCPLNKRNQDKGFTHFPIHWQAGSKFNVLLEQILSYSTAAQKVGCKFDIDPVHTPGKTWPSQTRPLELALEQGSGHRVYCVCIKLWWLQVLRSDGKMLVLSGLEQTSVLQCQDPWSICPGVPMPARAHTQLPLTAEAGLTYVAWSEKKVWLIVLMYTDVMKHRATPWVARSHHSIHITD